MNNVEWLSACFNTSGVQFGEISLCNTQESAQKTWRTFKKEDPLLLCNQYIYEMTTSYSWWKYCICYLEYTFLLGYFYSAPQKKKEENHAYIGEAYRILERAPSSCATRSKRRPRRSTKDGYSVWLTSLSQPKSTNICYLKFTYCYSRPINKSAVVQKHRQIFQLEIL